MLADELMTYRISGKRMKKLDKILTNIQNIRCNTVNNERMFSGLTSLIQHTRYSLSDESLNCLHFLKYYFECEEKKNTQ